MVSGGFRAKMGGFGGGFGSFCWFWVGLGRFRCKVFFLHLPDLLEGWPVDPKKRKKKRKKEKKMKKREKKEKKKKKEKN